MGYGLAVALLLLLAFEAWLHTDAFLVRFRSVFAAGRALDKTLYAERHCPDTLILGNSRADNAFDPATLLREAAVFRPRAAFNLGLPGADTRVLAGVLGRVARAGCFGAEGVRHVVLSLDEALLQPVDTLGQEIFLADRRQMLADGQWHDALRATLRTYGFAPNLRQLREPGTLARFVAATRADVEPVGGGAAEHLGYRAGFGGLQDAGAARRQEAGSSAPPSEANVRHLWRMLDTLSAAGVQVAVVFPPLLGREVLYRPGDRPEGAPYRAVAAELARRGVPVLGLDDGQPRSPSEFVNPGHLNDRGAQRVTRQLARELDAVWGAEGSTFPVAGSS